MVTVSGFLGMALDSTFEFSIYGFAKGKSRISTRLKGLAGRNGKRQ